MFFTSSSKFPFSEKNASVFCSTLVSVFAFWWLLARDSFLKEEHSFCKCSATVLDGTRFETTLSLEKKPIDLDEIHCGNKFLTVHTRSSLECRAASLRQINCNL